VLLVVRLWYIPGPNHSREAAIWTSLAAGHALSTPSYLATLTEAYLVSQFGLAPEETVWAGTVARRDPSMVVLLTGLKVFQSLGHFLPLAQIPATALSYVAKPLSLAALTDDSIDPRTTHRQNSAIRTYLGVTPWGETHGAAALEAAMIAALAEDSVHLAAVRHFVNQHRARRGARPPIPVHLPDDPGVRALNVRPYSLAD